MKGIVAEFLIHTSTKAQNDHNAHNSKARKRFHKVFNSRLEDIMIRLEADINYLTALKVSSSLNKQIALAVAHIYQTTSLAIF